MVKLNAIGILGGTFDPVHYGHLIAAEYARHEYGLERVLFIPAGNPPHKTAEAVTAQKHRFKMLQLAVQDNPAFALSPLEFQKKAVSYTVDTIEELKTTYAGAALHFIMGADSLLLFHTWKDYQRLADLCGFIVVTRPGYSLKQNEEALKKVPARLWGHLRQLEIPGLDISSSDIRARIAAGKPVKYLLPPSVEEYIRGNCLYLKGGSSYVGS